MQPLRREGGGRSTATYRWTTSAENCSSWAMDNFSCIALAFDFIRPAMYSSSGSEKVADMAKEMPHGDAISLTLN